jgi:hypothetical protein
MKSSISRLVLGFCMLLVPAFLIAQQDATSTGQSGMSSATGQSNAASDNSQPDMSSGTAHCVSATGCLKQGSEPGGYYLTSDDGKIWELTGEGLSSHVGHKVTVTGQQMKGSKSQEDKIETNEKSEAGGNPYGDLRVSNVQMVSASCQ